MSSQILMYLLLTSIFSCSYVVVLYLCIASHTNSVLLSLKFSIRICWMIFVTSNQNEAKEIHRKHKILAFDRIQNDVSNLNCTFQAKMQIFKSILVRNKLTYSFNKHVNVDINDFLFFNHIINWFLIFRILEIKKVEIWSF